MIGFAKIFLINTFYTLFFSKTQLYAHLILIIELSGDFVIDQITAEGILKYS